MRPLTSHPQGHVRAKDDGAASSDTRSSVFHFRATDYQPPAAPATAAPAAPLTNSGLLGRLFVRRPLSRTSRTPTETRHVIILIDLAYLARFRSRATQGSAPAPAQEIVISAPSNMRHTAHVGFDSKTGLDVSQLPPEYKKLFQAAGVKKSELKNPETAAALLDTVMAPPPPPPPPPAGGAHPPPPPPGPHPPPTAAAGDAAYVSLCCVICAALPGGN